MYNGECWGRQRLLKRFKECIGTFLWFKKLSIFPEAYLRSAPHPGCFHHCPTDSSSLSNQDQKDRVVHAVFSGMLRSPSHRKNLFHFLRAAMVAISLIITIYSICRGCSDHHLIVTIYFIPQGWSGRHLLVIFSRVLRSPSRHKNFFILSLIRTRNIYDDWKAVKFTVLMTAIMNEKLEIIFMDEN